MSDELQKVKPGFRGLLRSAMMTPAQRANEKNRNIVEYAPSSPEALFLPSQGIYNAIISGGAPSIRAAALVAQAECAFRNGFPVVALHEGDLELEGRMRARFSPSGGYFEIGGQSPRFEPFVGLDPADLPEQIMDTTPQTYGLDASARYYMEGLISYLHASGKHISFQRFASCPHGQIFDIVDDKERQGLIPARMAREIRSKLMLGQSENYKLQSCLNAFSREVGAILYRKKGGFPPANVYTAISRGGVMCFDIGSVANRLLMNTIVYHLRLAQRQLGPFVLLLDAIPLQAGAAYADFLKTHSDKVACSIASEDFFAMTGGDEKVFVSTVGNSQIFVVMGHTSAKSAEKWAEILGRYDMYDESWSYSRGSSRRTIFSILPSPYKARAVNTARKNEFVVKPEQITHLNRGEAYVLTAARGELCHLYLTDT